jgi:hypothetical protein
MTTHSATASLPSTDKSLILAPLALFVDGDAVGTNKKTHRPVASGGGFCWLLELCVAQLTWRPPPEDTLIRVDVPVLIDVIRLALAFWEVEVIGYRCTSTGNQFTEN